MSGGIGVRRGMLVRGRVTASDVPAGDAATQVQPPPLGVHAVAVDATGAAGRRRPRPCVSHPVLLGSTLAHHPSCDDWVDTSPEGATSFDYNQLAAARNGWVYLVHNEALPRYKGEPCNCSFRQGNGHQHQYSYVAVIVPTR